MSDKTKSCDMITYRKIIMNTLCRSETLAVLLQGAKETSQADTLPYKRIFPYEYLPDALTEADRFLCFELSTTVNSKNSIYHDTVISFYILGHKAAIPYTEEGNHCLWYDKAACELDTLFNDQTTLGIGKITLISNVPYRSQTSLTGRILTFKIKSFSKGIT